MIMPSHSTTLVAPPVSPIRSRPIRSRNKQRKADEDDAADAPIPAAPASPSRSRPYPDPKGRTLPKKGASKKAGKSKAVDGRDGAGEMARIEVGNTNSRDATVSYERTHVSDEEAPHDSELANDAHSAAISQSHANLPQALTAPQVTSYYPPSTLPAAYELDPSNPSSRPTLPVANPPSSRNPFSQEEETKATHLPSGSLEQLADGPEGHNARPPYPYSTLIRYAIEGSDKGKLTLAELYTAVEKRFPWFSKSGSGWKNSIRHNLSLNKNFIKVPRPLTEPGKGSYWCINNSANLDFSTADTGPIDPLRPDSNSAPYHPPVVTDDTHPAPPSPERKKRGRKKARPQEVDDVEVPPGHDEVLGQRYDQDAQITGGHSYEQGYEQYESPGERGVAPEDNTAPVDVGTGQWDGYGQREEIIEQPQQAQQHYQSQPETGYYPAQYQQHAHAPQLPPPGHIIYQDGGAYFASQGPVVPIPLPTYLNDGQLFIDDRPDRNAPRTIYNHSGSLANAGATNAFGPPPAGPFAHTGMYGRFGIPNNTVTPTFNLAPSGAGWNTVPDGHGTEGAALQEEANSGHYRSVAQ